MERELHLGKRHDRSFVPIPSIGRSGFRISGYAPASGVVALAGPFLRWSLASARLGLECHERRGRLAEVGQLPDDAPRNDVEVVWAGLTSLRGDCAVFTSAT